MLGLIGDDTQKVSYYDSSLELVSFVEGNGFGGGSVSKQADHLNINAIYTADVSAKSYVTDVVVDLTHIKTLLIDWENIGNDTSNTAYLVASTDKINGYGIYTSRLMAYDAFARRVDSLDVSALTGLYYLRIHARSATTGKNTNINVYSLRGVS